MIWVLPGLLKFGEGSGHNERPAYSVTPAGRGVLFWVLPCSSSPLGPRDRFYELWEIHYHTFRDSLGRELPVGDRPREVYSRTWIFERAEKLDFRVTGPLARYVNLTRGELGKPYAWWQMRGAPRLGVPPKTCGA